MVLVVGGWLMNFSECEWLYIVVGYWLIMSLILIILVDGQWL